ncbi:4'-phosphopantetheinyl transferase family protein [Streptomyces sp. NPDC001514]
MLGRRPEGLELGRAAGGRPYVRGVAGLSVSLSDTGGLLVVAVSVRGRVGVDAESATRRVYGTPLVPEMTTSYERTGLARLPERERNAALVRLWTLKEAYTKALGVGLRLPFTAFGLTDRAGPHGPDGRPVGPSERNRWHFGTDPDVQGCVVSWAVRDSPVPGSTGQPANFS